MTAVRRRGFLFGTGCGCTHNIKIPALCSKGKVKFRGRCREIVEARRAIVRRWDEQTPVNGCEVMAYAD